MILATSRGLGKRVANELCDWEVKVAAGLRDLGCDAGGGRARTVKVQRARAHKASRRRQRLRRLAVPAKRKKALARGTVEAAQLFGVEVVGL
eukprot:14644913-Alexandrium_andersonii.AAC.1